MPTGSEHAATGAAARAGDETLDVDELADVDARLDDVLADR